MSEAPRHWPHEHQQATNQLFILCTARADISQHIWILISSVKIAPAAAGPAGAAPAPLVEAQNLNNEQNHNHAFCNPPTAQYKVSLRHSYLQISTYQQRSLLYFWHNVPCQILPHSLNLDTVCVVHGL